MEFMEITPAWNVSVKSIYRRRFFDYHGCLFPNHCGNGLVHFLSRPDIAKCSPIDSCLDSVFSKFDGNCKRIDLIFFFCLKKILDRRQNTNADAKIKREKTHPLRGETGPLKRVTPPRKEKQEPRTRTPPRTPPKPLCLTRNKNYL